MKAMGVVVLCFTGLLSHGVAKADIVTGDGLSFVISEPQIDNDPLAIHWICACSTSATAPLLQAVEFGVRLSEPLHGTGEAMSSLREGDRFDIDIIAHSVFHYTIHDDLFLGFGLNVWDIAGNFAHNVAFLGATVNPRFSDISSQDGLNVDVVGFAFEGLTSSEVGPAFTLATLHFEALLAGESFINVSANSSDPNQGLIFWQHEPINFDTGRRVSIAAVPLPPSALMFVSTLLIRLVSRSKRRN